MSITNQSPEIEQMLETLNIKASRKNGMLVNFSMEQITTLSDLYTLSKTDIRHIVGDRQLAQQVFEFIMQHKHGNSIIKTMDDLKELEKEYWYLPMPTEGLNQMMTYSNGEMGLRSKTLVEIYGPAASGKTQICLSLAVQYLKQFDGKIIYIDTEGAFEGARFEKLMENTKTNYRDRIHSARIDTFDELEYAIRQFEQYKYGLIIVDSLMDPLQSQYPLGGDDLDNLVPRQQHLKKVTDKLKFIARVNNAIVVYTNHVRVSFDDNSLVPQGGNTLSHASDIRIELSIEDSKHIAKVVDCGFLPSLSSNYIISASGIANYKEIKTEVIEENIMI